MIRYCSAELDSVSGRSTLYILAPRHEFVILSELDRQAAVKGLSSGTSNRLKSATFRVTTVR